MKASRKLHSEIDIGHFYRYCVAMDHDTIHRSGFTLIELSIVLVIIGLIVGGVLVGRDLIAAAGIRSQISQIDEYQTAINTFKGKYNYLPGDIKDPDASTFGFVARGAYEGTGDGNGALEGISSYAAGQNIGYYSASGENGLFWRDLSTAALIKGGSFSTATASVIPTVPLTAVTQYFPKASIGGGGYGAQNFIYTYSYNTINYFSLSLVPSLSGGLPAFNGPGISVGQAFKIDTKIDDGLPGSGRVIAAMQSTLISGFFWADGAINIFGVTLPTTALAASATSCADNNSAAGVTRTYSITQNNGRGLNCALSFKFQ